MTDSPAGSPQRIGLEAFIGTDAFDKGMRKYLEGVGLMENRTDKAATKLSGGTGGGGGLAGALSLVGASMGPVGLAAAALANTFIGKLSEGFNKVIGFAHQFVDVMGGLQLAARVQELDYVVQIMGTNAGYTNQVLQDQIDVITSLGIRQDEARSALIQFMQAELDVARSGELARAAQDLAVVGAMDSSDAYQRLTYAIARQDTQILRALGITLNADEVMREYSKTTSETGEITETASRQQAFLNAVLDKAKVYAGAYEASMNSASKQLRSLTGREIPELTMAMGEPLVNAFFNVVKGGRELVQGFTMLIAEGGPLRDVLIAIGGAADLLTEPFLNAAKAFKAAVKEFSEAGTGPIRNMIDWFHNTFDGLIQKASDWGANLIEQFAEGMVAGIVAVINVLAYLGTVIASWLMPGSPPKILPDIDTWGAETMTEYMEGWKDADFSVFNDLSTMIKGYLSSTMGTTAADKGGMITSLLGSREAIVEAQNMVDELGEVTDEAINKVVSASGIGTEAFREYVSAMLQSELATKKVQDIQNEMVGVAEKWNAQLEALNAELNALTEGSGEQERLTDINAAISTGLLTTEEKTRLEAEKHTIELKQQIRSVEDQRDVELGAMNEKLMAAQKEQELNAENLGTQKELLQIQQEQNNLLKEYLAAQDASSKEAALKGAGGGAVGGLGGLGASIGAGLGEGIEDSLRTAIENAKNMLKERLTTMWNQFKADFKGRFPELFEAWETLKTEWAPVFEGLKKWWKEDVVPAWETAVNYWNEELGPALNDMWDWFVTKGIPAIEDLAKTMIWMVNSGMVEIKRYWDEELHPALDDLWMWITEEGAPAIVDITSKTSDWVSEGFERLYNYWIEYISPFFSTMNRFINQDLVPTVELITELFITFRETALRSLRELWDESIEPMLKDMWIWFDTKIYPTLEPIVNLFNRLGSEIWKEMAKVWTEDLQPALSEMWASFKENYGPLKRIRDLFGTFLDFIRGAHIALGNLRVEIATWIDEMKSWSLPKWLERNSPSEFEVTLMNASKIMKDMNTNLIPDFNAKLNILNGASFKNGMFSGAGNVTNNYYNRSTTLTMNPQYAKVQSPSSVYWDASAALSAARV